VSGKVAGSNGIAADDTSLAEVARYYDRNTGRFLLMGRGGVYAIHRELWGPGVRTARDAADHVNTLLAGELAELAGAPDAVVLDFGCGVGGTLFRLTERFPDARFHGITVSERQAEIAVRLAERLGLAHCSFIHGDFHSTDVGRTAHAVVAVESFAHSRSATAFLGNVSRHLDRGGRLMLVDDFLAREEDALDPPQRMLVQRFRAGWRVHAVDTVDRLVREAVTQGLAIEKNVDLTPLVRTGTRIRDRLVAVLGPSLSVELARFPFLGNLIGGHALQVGLREGFLQYRLLVFRKTA
jgi:SAM-dependent methyltransferase